VLCSSGGPDKKFDGVLKRVRAQQEAQDKANAALQASKAATVSMLIPDAKVDWSKFKSAPTRCCCCALCCWLLWLLLLLLLVAVVITAAAAAAAQHALLLSVHCSFGSCCYLLLLLLLQLQLNILVIN